MKELSLILSVNLNTNDVILINFSKLNMLFMSVLISEFDHSAKQCDSEIYNFRNFLCLVNLPEAIAETEVPLAKTL